MSATPDIVARLSSMAADHGPDGWPAVQMREITALCDEVTRLRAEQRDERDRLRAALAQADAEPELWQYRWTNPAGDLGSEDNMAWKRVVVRRMQTMQTMQQRIDELLAYRYDGKPIYEVRALYAHPAPAQREPLSDDAIKGAITVGVQSGEVSWLGFERGAAGEYTLPALSPQHYQIARAIERAHGITPSGTKGAARTEDAAPGDLANAGVQRPA